MTHGSHRFVAHRLGGDPVDASAHRRGRLLPDLRDGRRPLPDGRGARAEVLAPPLRAARAPGPRDRAFDRELPELDAALPHADDARVARPARARGHLRRAGPVARRVGCGALVKLAAIAFALFGIHVGARPHDPGRLRARVEPGRGAHRLRDARRPLGRGRRRQPPGSARRPRRPAGLGAERPPARVRPRRLGLDDPCRRPRRAEARAGRPPRLVAGRRAHRLRPGRRDLHGALVVRRRAEATPAPAPIPPTPPTDGWRSSPTDRSRRRQRRRTGHVAGLVGRRTARVGARRDDLHRRPASTAAGCSRPGRPRAACASYSRTSTSARRPAS